MSKKTIYATKEKLDKVNNENVELVRKYFVSKNMNLSPSTVAAYQSDFNQWTVFIMERYDNAYILDFDTEDAADMIEDYIAFCTSVLDNNERRIQRRMSSISSFYIYLRKKRKITENPVDLLERVRIGSHEKPIIKQTFLTQEQVDEIRTKLTEIKDIQLQCFFEFGISTFARINAIVNVKVDQIDFDNELVIDVLEKEGYIVNLMPSKKCFALIKKWLEYRKRNNIESEYLFINKSTNGLGKQISKSTIQSSWIKKIGNLIGVPDLHCHDLRHSGANICYHNGMSLEKVSSFLNHRGTQVTQDFYLKMDYGKLKEEKDEFEF